MCTEKSPAMLLFILVLKYVFYAGYILVTLLAENYRKQPSLFSVVFGTGTINLTLTLTEG